MFVASKKCLQLFVMFFHSNLKLLRTRKGLTQDALATALDMPRSTLSGYENGVAQPSLEALIGIAGFFSIAIDTLVKMDLGKLSEYHLSEMERGFDVFVTGSKLRVLATTVDEKNKENIEMVPIKAKAGYKSGYADPGFIEKLPAFQLPLLLGDRKYRMFQLDGDSMHPIPDKSWVIAEYVENWHDIKTGQAYVLLTQEDGIVFKQAENKLRTRNTLMLHSLNPAYKPYELHVSEIREVWKFYSYLSSELPDAQTSKELLMEAIQKVEAEVGRIKTALE